MKKLFARDVAAAQAFMAAIEFPKQFSPRSGSEESVIRPCDKCEIVQGEGKTQVLLQVGMLVAQKWCVRMVEEFGFTHIDTTVNGPIAQTANFNTPFGFTFHLHVVFA